MERLSIALVSDFYLPDLGGVQLQIKELAKYLMEMGHKVIVVTHCRPDHFGMMFLQGISTYYLAWGYSASGAVYPSFFLDYLQAKQILVKQQIDIVHVHQSSSTLGVSYGIYAYHLGLKIVHTEHSLFSLRDNTNLHFSLAISTVYKLYNKFICVSRAVRNNLILRSYIASNKTVVIPNAVLSSKKRLEHRINQKVRIVVVGRLVYRRGVDLLIKFLPQFCQRNKNRFKMDIIGNGPKMKPLKLTIEKHKLEQMIVLQGSLPNEQTLSIVEECDIFLSTALTESFGIALVEAAHLGLKCVSTNVGGVSQILPSNQLHTVSLNSSEIINKLQELIDTIQKRQKSYQFKHQRQIYYRKQDCFERVVEVYRQVEAQQIVSKKKQILSDIFKRGSGAAILLVVLFGLFNCMDFFSKAGRTLKRKLKKE